MKNMKMNYATLEQLPYTYQPHPMSHTHVISQNEIVPGFTKQEFVDRIDKLVELMQDHSVFILGSREDYFMSPGVRYPYRQDSNFYYLTGVSEPECFLVIDKTEGGQKQATLYVREKSNKEFFHGVVNGVGALKSIWEDSIQIKPMKQFLRDLQAQVKNHNIIYYDPKYDEELSNIILKFGGGPEAFKGENGKYKIFYPDALVSILRSIKSKAEIDITKKCAKISAAAFIEVMKKIRPGMSESHVEAILEFECKIRGAQRLGYPPVVASGNRATIIHYLTNNHIAEDGDLIRIDGAAEYYSYMNDITRTFPVNGKFSPIQKKVYQAVLDIQKKCIDYLKKHTTETITINSYHDYSVRLTHDVLAERFGFGLGFDKNTWLTKQIIEECIYPHMIGHPTGMNIHESVPSRDEKLGPGMIITCEPGLYFSEQAKASIRDASLWGIGAQVEDDILLTEDGIEILTHETPKEVEEIESIMQDGRKTSTIAYSF